MYKIARGVFFFAGGSHEMPNAGLVSDRQTRQLFAFGSIFPATLESLFAHVQFVCAYTLNIHILAAAAAAAMKSRECARVGCC
jgi:hypothetical protein